MNITTLGNHTHESILYDEFSNQDHDHFHDDDENHSSESSSSRRRIKCLHRDATCTSKSCEQFEECKHPNLYTDCYAIMREVYEPTSDQLWIQYLAKNCSLNSFFLLT